MVASDGIVAEGSPLETSDDAIVDCERGSIVALGPPPRTVLTLRSLGGYNIIIRACQEAAFFNVPVY